MRVLMSFMVVLFFFFGDFFKKRLAKVKYAVILVTFRGRSSAVERHVANVNVVSSNLIARFLWLGAGFMALGAKDLSDKSPILQLER